MRIRVLGAHGGESPVCGPCGFLIDGTTALEAGTICSVLPLEAQREIRQIFISHIHLDHVKSIPFLAENLFERRPKRPVVIVGLEAVMEELQRHLLNDHIWPDFTRLPSAERPVLVLRGLKQEVPTRVGDVEVTAFPMNHTVPCAGYIIRKKGAAFVFSGDTGDTERLWQAAADAPDLRAAFIEATFPDELDQLADESLHLTPRTFHTAFERIGRPDLPVYAYHMKPRYYEEIHRELTVLPIKHLTVLECGMELTL